MIKSLPKTYKPQDKEREIYKMWEEGGYFTPRLTPKKKPFSIIMPPPNANGPLHIGHAVFVTLEDIMIRYHRMKGDPTLWLPGADHAGIPTQVVFEKELQKKGKTRFDLGRKKFFDETYKFTMKNKKTMENQLRRLGASCDWTRVHFTLEEEISKAVLFVFKKMYDQGLIYRGKRIINWCPRCGTALSDLEVIYKERKTKLIYLKYPIKAQGSGLRAQGSIVVATTRPETMLGDTAVAVNPNDKRYKNLVGKIVILPLVNREIPIITDEAVDPKFGTGAVKVTPAHDPLDFEISQRNKLSAIQVISKEGEMTKETGGDYASLDILECRKKVIADLKKLNLIEKEEDYIHSVGTCERCKTTVEPMLSSQWFVKMKPLREEAIKAVKQGKIKFLPKRFEKIYFNWLENIRDWCISRQIWWGHRIPVWYCLNCDGDKIPWTGHGVGATNGKLPETQKCILSLAEGFSMEGVTPIVSIEKPKKCQRCGKDNLVQDPDTLDTWFSSALWPLTTLGWPKKTKDFKYFYPTSVMETGWDILFFWVARMIMMGLYCTEEVPFRIVYLHGLVRDKDRQKMSKSRGNVIDPLGVINLYGTDALRMALVFGTGIGADIIISEEKIKAFRNFANKIWNASRFVISNLDKDIEKLDRKKLKVSLEDEWILTELENIKKHTTALIENYRFHEAAQRIYDFFWHRFCDKFIEETKKRLYNPKSEEEKRTAQWVLYRILTDSLKLLHPFMPFVTEYIWGKLGKKKPLIIESWPK